MAKILRHIFGTIKTIRSGATAAKGYENEEIREKLVLTFNNNTRHILDNGFLWNSILKEKMFLTKPFGTQVSLQNSHQMVSKIYWSFSFKDFVGQLWKKRKGNVPMCETKKKKKIQKPRCAKKKSKKKCSKTKKTCLDPSKKKKQKLEAKEDPCSGKSEKKEGKNNKGKKDDPCKDVKAKKADPCEKEEDSSKKNKGKKDDPCKDVKAKKADPCEKEEDSSKKNKGKKDDPCKDVKAKKADPCAMKEDSAKKKKGKKDDPCKELKAKKADPCEKEEDSSKKNKGKKDDPCKDVKAKKADPCAMKEDSAKKKKGKKDDPCKELKAKKADPCAKKEDSSKKKKGKKDDPCKDVKAKKADPCAQKEDSSKKNKGKEDDPCKDVKAKKADPCEKEEDSSKNNKGKKDDPCKDVKAKKADPCAKKEDSSKKKKGNNDDPCKDLKAKKADPCVKEEDSSKKNKGKKDDPCKDMKAKKADPCAKEEDSSKKKKGKKDDPCKDMKAKKADPCAKEEDSSKKKKGKKDDPCKDVKAKKADPCAKEEDSSKKKKGKKDDPCKDVKAKKADPCAKEEDSSKKKKGKKDDPCKNIKPKKADPCAKSEGGKVDPGKTKDPCTKLIKGAVTESFMLDNRSSISFGKQYPLTALLTSEISRRLVPAYSKLTVRSLKQLNINNKIIYKNESRQRRMISNKIMKGNIRRIEINKIRIKKEPVSCSLLNLVGQAKKGLTDCIVLISDYKKSFTSETFNLSKRINSLRSMVGFDLDRVMKKYKCCQKPLEREHEITKQVSSRFEMPQRNEINNTRSTIPYQFLKRLANANESLMFGPTTTKVSRNLLRYFGLDKVKDEDHLSSKIVLYKDKPVIEVNKYAQPIMQEYCKKCSECNSRIYKLLLKFDPYFRGFSNDSDHLQCTNLKESQISKISQFAHFDQQPRGDKKGKTKYCSWKKILPKINEISAYSKDVSFLDVFHKNSCIPEPKSLKKKSIKEFKFPDVTPSMDIDFQSANYIVMNKTNETTLKMSLFQDEKTTPVVCPNKKSATSRGGSCNRLLTLLFEKSPKENGNDISNFDNSNRIDLIFEHLRNNVYCCNMLDILIYCSSNADNRCMQISNFQRLNSLDTDIPARGVSDSSINSNGIQFYIDTEKCHRKKHGKRRKLPDCYDPDVESPIDDLWNRGEQYWPFYDECHKRIKDPNTYPPGNDPNANHMLFGHL